MLSHVLGAWTTGTEPERLLAGRARPAGPGLWCGAVRSRDTLLVVFSRHADVGVDLQSGSVLYDESLHLALTRWEQGILRRLSLSSRHAFFLALWARKEAVLRAAGHGLRIRQSEVEVLIEGGAGTVPVPLPFDGGIMEVHLRDLPFEGGTVAAVASTTPVTALYTWDFDRS
ncbi:4'-phosphopantetheinyl transferase superfamily protein [Streptomyces sp. RKND-216]|uniref:4'-phosphopantetheinyl transferase superfamily protein n=1 Tax=Streptomyces sp. RKND-216 TaxID=2562581 RepID=UPI0014466356|nr:4'-phosphopantetheinyl transferase superfamily protein [Streptomyces sp. RKND-216]